MTSRSKSQRVLGAQNTPFVRAYAVSDGGKNIGEQLQQSLQEENRIMDSGCQSDRLSSLTSIILFFVSCSYCLVLSPITASISPDEGIVRP